MKAVTLEAYDNAKFLIRAIARGAIEKYGLPLGDRELEEYLKQNLEPLEYCGYIFGADVASMLLWQELRKHEAELN